jgi:hypothetical protein
MGKRHTDGDEGPINANGPGADPAQESRGGEAMAPLICRLGHQLGMLHAVAAQSWIDR